MTHFLYPAGFMKDDLIRLLQAAESRYVSAGVSYGNVPNNTLEILGKLIKENEELRAENAQLEQAANRG